MSDNNVRSGLGFFDALTIVFIILKLCKVIDWSWWWVLAPTWIPVALLVIILVVALVVEKLEERK